MSDLIDAAIRVQAMQIEQELLRLHCQIQQAAPATIGPVVGHKSPAIQDEVAAGASDKQRIGGVSTATPADQAGANFPNLNPNTNTVQAYPKGRWT